MNTLVTTYYEDPDYLEKYIEYNFQEDVFSHLIIVDDASSKFPAKKVLTKFKNKNISLYEIKEDIGFNSHAARNLAATQCKTEWATFLDVDHVLTSETFDDIIRFVELEENEWLWFGDNQFMIPSKYFLAVGGYDERLNGYRYGTYLIQDRLDRLFSREKLNPWNSTLLTRTLKGLHGITRQSKEQMEKNKAKEAEIKLNSSANPLDWHKHKMLTFEWNKICL